MHRKLRASFKGKSWRAFNLLHFYFSARYSVVYFLRTSVERWSQAGVREESYLLHSASNTVRVTRVVTTVTP